MSISSIPFEPNDPGLSRFYNSAYLWSAPFGLMLLENLPLTPGATLLDVGCATGFPLLEIAERLGSSSRCFGLDPWASAIEYLLEKTAYEQRDNIEGVVGDAAAMPFANDFFDLIVSNLGLNNFDNAQAALQECKRVIKPGGVLAVTTNLDGHFAQFYEVFTRVLQNAGLEQSLLGLSAHQRKRGSIDSVTSQFEIAGFELTRVVRRNLTYRYSNGTALLESRFIRFAFLSSWQSLVPEARWSTVFGEVERLLNELPGDCLCLDVPMAYLEFKAPSP